MFNDEFLPLYLVHFNVKETATVKISFPPNLPLGEPNMYKEKATNLNCHETLILLRRFWAFKHFILFQNQQNFNSKSYACTRLYNKFTKTET